MALTDTARKPEAYFQSLSRWHPVEIVFWLATLLPFVLLPNYLSLASQIAITALFALSLDLILGYAGIVSLGHAAFFGLGAYTAGLLSKHGWGEPLSGLAAAAAVAAIVGYATSFIIARFRHLALIMLTLGFGLLLGELANSASWLTGGVDGLQGIQTWDLFGLFHFGLYGTNAYGYALAVLFLLFLFSRRLINSPFGLALRGIRENRLRMPAIGAPTRQHIRTVYTLSAAMAGIAGAMLAQTTETVSLEFAVLRPFRRIAGDAGAGRRRPALRRAGRRHDFHGGARPVLRHQPAILVFLDRHSPGGGGGLPAQRHPRRPVEARGALEAPVSAIALATRGLAKSFGSLVVARDIELKLPVGARYALIGPNGAGKTTLINLMTGMLAPDAGQILLGAEDITDLEPQQRVQRGLARTFQINTLFPSLNALEAVTLAVAERRGVAREFWRNIAVHKEAIEEAYEILVKLRLGDDCYQQTRELPYGRQRLLGDRAGARHQAEGAVARRAGRRRAARRIGRNLRGGGESLRRSDAFVHRARHARGVPFCHPHHRAGRRQRFHRGLAGRDRRRSGRARSLFGDAQAWLTCSPSTK